ncbi:SRPBCC family protein [Mucilaginibacter paludis]|uniref:Activator of Hsp90 ATPase 1 family protein n=1 Tax=Mucilaginibacter paludis DSM 18603 TaxID=714943 RepID=H1Y354_9SPHI|nr:SRPBCC domain-containing protein [Mucilaginibacter paludis]EHQ28872.1 Activator of Hsp90 ATPase 1 family protein [Mucilaginibacter paludis DSM 18603]
MAAKIKHQLFFPHQPKAVWEYLTSSELLELWLMKNDFKPELGHEFTFKAGPAPNFEFDGIIYCKVLEIVPYQKLSYSWKLGPGDGTFNVDSVVFWELRPRDNGTELLLEHSDFTVMKHIGIFDAMNTGWLRNIQKILEHLNTIDNGSANA